MKITRFDRFISESNTQQDNTETFKYIFLDLIDEGFDIEFESVFFDSEDSMEYTRHQDISHTKPGYFIRLVRNFDDDNMTVDFNLAKKVMEILDNCNSLLSGHGKYTIEEILFKESYFRIEYRVIDSESTDIEVNTSEGFDDFISNIRAKWGSSYNKVTRSFEFKITKDGIVLSPKEDVNVSPLLTSTKAFVQSCLTKKYYVGGGPNWKYNYDVKLVGKEIHINFKDRLDTTPVGSRRY